MIAAVAIGTDLTPEDLYAVARLRAPTVFDPDARVRVEASRRAIEAVANGGDDAPRVYGVNTGFGFLAETRISAEHVRTLQRNLVRSHACGVGAALGTDVVRAMILLRAQVLARGFSGVRPVLIERLSEMLNRGVHPVIPSQGSVGASGDLAPLAHLALVLIGEGRAEFEGTVYPGEEALSRAGIAPVELEAKEGLALINGTQLMCAIGTLALLDAESLAWHADLAGAMSLEAQQGSWRPFEARVVGVRPHPGALASAHNLRQFLSQSEIAESHLHCGKVQDAYSFRCMPQVHGASRDAMVWVRSVLAREINSATDNPLVFLDDKGEAEVISGGNFHGQPLALALDLLCIACAELANISERRIEQLVNPALSSGLPAFLAKNSGLDSGFMIAQVTAAALVSENKVLCHPASVDSIPSSAGKEDHVSMGSISATKCARVVEHVRYVLAIEIMVAAQGLDYRLPLTAGLGARAAHLCLREKVATLDGDRELHGDIHAATELVRAGVLMAAVQRAVGAVQ
ncbi:MAG: histidine ammonia-lyase [Deltaproteobacteria bacterium]|nr:histidine ammonia-lyase [Deltaproteobacteria bacterium]